MKYQTSSIIITIFTIFIFYGCQNRSKNYDVYSYNKLLFSEKVIGENINLDSIDSQISITIFNKDNPHNYAIYLDGEPCCFYKQFSDNRDTIKFFGPDSENFNKVILSTSGKIQGFKIKYKNTSKEMKYLMANIRDHNIFFDIIDQ